MTETGRGIQEVVRRIRGEFLEMPGLRLTSNQARRLWCLDEMACEAVLGALVDACFLARTRDGAFVLKDGNSPADLASVVRPPSGSLTQPSPQSRRSS